MDNEIEIVEPNTTNDLIKDAATKAIVGAIIGFAVGETLILRDGETFTAPPTRRRIGSDVSR